MLQKGRTAEVAPLNLSDTPDLEAVLRSAAEGLGCEPYIDPANSSRQSNERNGSKNQSHSNSGNQPKAQRAVGLSANSPKQKEYTAPEGNVEKHTLSVGTDTVGETVSFTAKLLGTAQVNAGKEAEGGMDWTYYRLPDHTYRVLIDDGSVSMLLQCDMADALRRGKPAEYGSWTLVEPQNEGEYGRVFAELMKRHPEVETRNVSDLD